jgi:tRNA 5-methylaminomethyl-2-thiouridine biosynthesis bifunctional protein
MKTPDRHWRGAPLAELSWRAGATPVSTRFEDVYYSTEQGIAESRHVFLAGNGLPGRWRNRGVFTIGETGFGTGLNFLLTWHSWRADPHRPAKLHFVSTEKYPLALADLQRCLANWPELHEAGERLAASWPPPAPGRHRLLFEQGAVVLDLLLGDVLNSTGELTSEPGWQVDAWYLDGFAPARNPEMWSPALYEDLVRLSAPGATLATFTAAGEVRRGLQAVGFALEKTPGFGSKREMLRGTLAMTRPGRRPPTVTPWHLPPPAATDTSVLVLGGGLAGCSVAAALANRGWRVTLLDRSSPAGAASGNTQGILYTRVSHQHSDLNSFTVHSYLFALRHYAALAGRGRLALEEHGSFCGALHLEGAPAPGTPLAATIESLPGLCQVVDSQAAEALSGLPSCPGGLFYPGSGWLSPPAVCRAYLDTPGITVLADCGTLQLRREEERWLAIDEAGQPVASAAVAVVATGVDAQPGLEWLPLQSIRGQVTRLPSRGPLVDLRTVICHDGYLPPAWDGEHCIGATFDIGDPETGPRVSDHAHNLERLAHYLPALERSLDPAALEGRVGFRCATPDYLPVVGPLPDRQAFLEDYAGLRRNARRVIDRPARFLPGLFISTGHGSRGLTSTPLAAELLAAQVTGQPWPVETALCRALAPARFLARDLARNRL